MYTDGFVKSDAGTALDGTTSNWRYDQSTQVRDGFIDFHATGGRQVATAGTGYESPRDWGFDGSGGAPFLQFDWLHDIGLLWAAGLQAQWSFLSFDGDHRGTNFSALRTGADYRINVLDSYALQGVIPPAAPYEGSGMGNGPLLDNIPSNRNRIETRTNGTRVEFFNDVRDSLDVDLHTISLGPTVNARLGSTSLQFASGVAVNIASWDATHDESLLVSRNRGALATWKQWHTHVGGTEILPGFYVQGAVTVPVTNRVSLMGFGRYDWSQPLDGAVGPSAFSVDLSGWSVGALVGVSF